MAKQKTAFVCNDCGSDYSKWQGQCNDCGAWNTLAEIKLGPAKGSGRAGAGAGRQCRVDQRFAAWGERRAGGAVVWSAGRSQGGVSGNHDD